MNAAPRGDAPDAPPMPLASPLTDANVMNPVQFGLSKKANKNNDDGFAKWGSDNVAQPSVLKDMNGNPLDSGPINPLDGLGGPGAGPGPGSMDTPAPVLRTPALTAHGSLQYPGPGGAIDFGPLGGSALWGNWGNDGGPANPLDGMGGPADGGMGSMGLQTGKTPFSDIFGWSWEVGSEAGSMPSVWSKATSMRSGSSKFGAWALTGDGQRLIYIKPQEVPVAEGGTVIIGLRKEIPEMWWNQVEILLVGGKEGQVTLKPSGIRKGKKLCIRVPPGLECRDYDVRVVFAGKILHGAIPLAVRGDSDSENEDEDEEEKDNF